MTRISAILHTRNDELRIARAIESLRPCDEVLVIDHESSDETRDVARRLGARVLRAHAGDVETRPYLGEAYNDWIFCLHPAESFSEALEASVFEWKLQPGQGAYGVTSIEETVEGWIQNPIETRLVHRTHSGWQGWKPLGDGGTHLLQGHLIRLRLP